MEPWVAFVAGLTVGIVIGIGVGRIRGATVPGIPAATSPGSESLPAIPVGAKRVIASSSVRIEGDTLSVVVNGRTYHRLADVPAGDRDLLVKELELVEDGDVPEAMRRQVRAFLAGSAGNAG
jgi:hypothetical protein